MRYHINNNGDSGICEAGKGNKSTGCPFGEDAIHGVSELEVRAIYESIMSSKTVPSSQSVSYLRSMPASALAKISLKHLDVSQLTQTLRHEAINLGMDPDVIDSSIDLATILHAHQTRGSRGHFESSPYIEHPLRNALRLVRLGVKDQDIVVAAVLHDTIEDGAKVFVKTFHNKSKVKELDAREALRTHTKTTYGSEVLRLVDAVTNDYMTYQDSANMSHQDKRDLYLRHVRDNIKDNPKVMLVKISDFIDNATGLYHNTDQKRNERTKRQAAKYLPVVDVFKQELNKRNASLSEDTILNLLDKMETTKKRLVNIMNR